MRRSESHRIDRFHVELRDRDAAGEEAEHARGWIDAIRLCLHIGQVDPVTGVRGESERPLKSGSVRDGQLPGAVGEIDMLPWETAPSTESCPPRSSATMPIPPKSATLAAISAKPSTSITPAVVIWAPWKCSALSWLTRTKVPPKPFVKMKLPLVPASTVSIPPTGSTKIWPA